MGDATPDAKRRREIRGKRHTRTTIREKRAEKTNNTRGKGGAEEKIEETRVGDRVKSFREIQRRKDSTVGGFGWWKPSAIVWVR